MWTNLKNVKPLTFRNKFGLEPILVQREDKFLIWDYSSAECEIHAILILIKQLRKIN